MTPSSLPDEVSQTCVTSYVLRTSPDVNLLLQCISSLLDDETRLRLFQEGGLPEADEQWYKLVPKEAQQVLSKEEVQRQSVIFEVIQSEREYVRDLESVKMVFIQNLRDYSPISPRRIDGFISEVFWNLDEILRYHKEMLNALFARQMEQHPLIQGIADIVLAGEYLPCCCLCVLTIQAIQLVLSLVWRTRNISNIILLPKPCTARNYGGIPRTNPFFPSVQKILVSADVTLSLSYPAP